MILVNSKEQTTDAQRQIEHAQELTYTTKNLSQRGTKPEVQSLSGLGHSGPVLTNTPSVKQVGSCESERLLTNACQKDVVPTENAGRRPERPCLE